MRGEIFQFIKSLAVPSASHDLSHGGDVTVDMGYLCPIDVWECLPGDFWKFNQTSLIKFQAMLAPLQHRVDVSFHFFFVPTRLLWKHYEDFFTGGKDGTLAPVMPYVNASDLKQVSVGGKTPFDSGMLANYLTHCNDVSSSINLSALPFMGYQFIWNEMFRDQNLQDPIEIPTDFEGEIDPTDPEFEPLFLMRRRCWEKDYFTSALPFAQRGPEVLASLAGSAPVKGEYLLKGEAGQLIDGEDVVVANVYPGGKMAMLGNMSGEDILSDQYTDPKGNTHGLFADLSNASAFSINDLRLLEKSQEWLESMARSGGRYVEQLLGMWHVISPDARMQRPELIGYVKSPVQVRELLQTSPNMEDGSSEVSGVGTQTGQAVSVSSGKYLHKFCHEHGYIFCLCSVMPRTSYTNTLSKMWTRSDRYDFAWPGFAHLGEQEVKNYEVQAAHENPEGVFGYQSRYAEYKYLPDFFAGDFADTLTFWHLGRILPKDVSLNSDFVSCVPRDDIFAVPSEPGKVKVNIWFDIKCVRKLPKFSIPRFG